jgi:hypothetical protein
VDKFKRRLWENARDRETSQQSENKKREAARKLARRKHLTARREKARILGAGTLP